MPDADPPLDGIDAMSGIDTESPFGTHRASPFDRAVWASADWRPLPASLRRRLRKRFARPRAGPFDVTFDGVRWRLYPAENQCDRIVFGRRDWPEPAEHAALPPHLSPGMTYVDIGANVGSYALFVGTRTRAMGAAPRILTFEPHPRTRAKLATNLALNDLTADILPFALGEANDTMTLWSDGGSNIGHTSLIPEATANPARGVAVKVRRLPDILAERGVTTIDLLKIDIEGFEDRALGPLLDSSEALWPKTILLETAHRAFWQRDLTAMLAERGYRGVFATRENTIVTR